MSRLPRRAIVLAVTLVLTVIALLRYGVPVTILVMAVGVTAAVLVGRHQAGRFSSARKGPRGPVWRPKVHHQELPAPADDPVIGFAEPVVELFASRTPPLAHLELSATVRSQLDGFALGRTRRIIEAPDLLVHAAADAETWPVVETAVQKTMALARSRGVEVRPEGQPRLMQALALSAVHGVLLAEWRQLEDGATVWDGATARIRASGACSLEHISDETERPPLPALDAATERRPPDFEARLSLPYAPATRLYPRLHGKPPAA